MIFNKHLELEGQHAVLGASNYHWINYDEEKFKKYYANQVAKEKGTRLHEFASECIDLGQKLPKSKKTLNMFVNDAIGYKMNSEQGLYYSKNAFGTADAVSFKNGLLRIHDLKTGIIPASMHQLEVYAAFFCLEYKIKPSDIDMEFRIYQSDEVVVLKPDIEAIKRIIEKAIIFDKYINNIEEDI